MTIIEQSTLHEVEAADLVRYETVIERGLTTFYDVGTALLAIRDQRLYRAEHPTFEAYCRERWNLKQSRVYQMMDAAAVVGNLKSSTIVELPTNEAQARPLAAVPPAERAEVWQEAVETAPNGKVTAAHVNSVVQRHIAPPAIDDEPLDPYEEAIAAQHQAKQAEQPRVVLTSQESTEWYTPAWCIKAVREALGTIDLDPASTPLANRIVQANWIYTEELDGLAQPWKATTVFVNPPYNGDAAAWCRKAVTEYREGRSKAVILLVFAKLGYQWFEELFDAAPTCLVRRRISFIRPDGCDAGEAKHGSAFVYFGPEPERFRAAFASVGRVILPTEGR